MIRPVYDDTTERFLLFGRGATGGTPSPLLTDLVAYLKLDAVSPSLADEVNGYDLTPHGVTAGTGILGGCAVFDGAASYASVASNADLSIDGSLSGAAWVRVDGFGSDVGCILGKFSGSTNEYLLGTDNATSEVFFATWIGGTLKLLRATSAGPIATGVFRHVAFGWDAGSSLIWISVNAGARDTLAIVGTPTTGDSDFTLGRNDSTGGVQYFHGAVDEPGLWKRVLTEPEVASLYNGGAGLAYPFT